MYRRLLLASFAVLVAFSGAARGNGRPPATSTIHFRQGNPNDIAVGLTFGLVLSHDGGQTWTWMCEDAVGYAGTYDPFYAYDAAGELYATTFDGLKLMTDGCSFNATASGTTFISINAIDANGAFYYSAVQTPDTTKGIIQDFKIYKIASAGAQPVGVDVADPEDKMMWWQSILPAPSDPQIVYLSGYSFVPGGGGGGSGSGSNTPKVRKELLYRSDNGGATWTKLPMTGLAVTASNATIDVVGVWDTDPAHVYARVEFIDTNNVTDALYVSTDKGVTWTEIRRKPNPMAAFVVRGAAHSHDLLVGTPSTMPELSHDDGKTWSALDTAPHANCLTENAAGEVWACTQNYDIGTTPSDGAGIMKSTDLATWTKVLRYQDLTDPVSCAAGTIQHDTCAPAWCAFCDQLGCKPSSSVGCVGPEAQTSAPASKGGCCDAGTEPGGPLALGLSVATVLSRRRRRGKAT